MYILNFTKILYIFCPYGNISISSLFKSLTANKANMYIITAKIIEIAEAILSAIIPFKNIYKEYEHIAIIIVHITGFIKNLPNPKFNFIFFLNTVNPIVNDII